jgi:poly(A) polymerase
LAPLLQEQGWMKDPATLEVMAVLRGEGGEARFVGGCVRDALLGRAIVDIDIATPLKPAEVMRRLEAAGIKAVPIGLTHGTVTAVIPPRSFEITTLRRDVETFGRHARVAFTADWAEDARRRDFTMNALFLDSAGQIFDYVGGMADLAAGHVRFVGDAATRIREDVLRLLRFYRFHANYGKAAADAEARAAARALAHLLPKLSGERVAAELFKLLAAPDPVPTLRLMEEDGVLQVLLPMPLLPDRLAQLLAIAPASDALLRLGALVELDAAGAAALAQRLKLANALRDRLTAFAAPPWPIDLGADSTARRRALYHLGADLYRDLVLLAAAGQGVKPDAALLAAAAAWRPIALPVQGRDLRSRGVPAGPEMGRLLAELEAWWEAGDFRAGRDACLAELDRRIGKPHG